MAGTRNGNPHLFHEHVEGWAEAVPDDISLPGSKYLSLTKREGESSRLRDCNPLRCPCRPRRVDEICCVLWSWTSQKRCWRMSQVVPCSCFLQQLGERAAMYSSCARFRIHLASKLLNSIRVSIVADDYSSPSIEHTDCGALDWHIWIQGEPGSTGVCRCKDGEDKIQTLLQPDGDSRYFVVVQCTVQTRYGYCNRRC